MKRIYLFEKVPFDAVSQKQLIRLVGSWAYGKGKKFVVNMNAYGVVTYLKNEKYRKVMDSADLIYADGWGPVYASRFFKNKLKTRVNVGDFIGPLLFSLAKNKLKLYILGSTPDEVKKTAETIKMEYKNLVICGYHDGYFSKRQSEKVISGICKAKPNLVLVGMGLPLQEYFIRDNWELLPNAVYMGVGGVFHYIAGIKSRAPMWMRERGLEWLYRLIQEPQRLGRRYTVTNLEFLFYLLRAFLKVNLSKLKVSFVD